ncbi:hypothetical protein ACKKBG_A08650 [Auxenochlorella protothecoides x Auxenochlorella symbiontica]
MAMLRGGAGDATPLTEASEAPPSPSVDGSTSLTEGAALMAQRSLFKQSSTLLSTWNYPGSEPCPNNESEISSAWRGVTCSSGVVVAIHLEDLGLGGQLSPALSALGSLLTMNLKNNGLTGSLPEAWAFPDLLSLNLADNALTGSLPASWAEAGAFESLSFMQLQNNNLAGTIPSKFWSGSAFNTDTGSSLYVRPGNQLLCGSVTTVLAGNTTLLQLMALDLFTPGAVTTITNTLGPCLRACTAADAGAAEITTNVFDLAQEYNVSLTDVIALNPGLKNLPGVAVTLPCYQTPYRGDTLIGGSDAGYGQFAGGNQVLAVYPDGPALAGAVTMHTPGSGYTAHVTPGYAGSTSWLTEELVEPVYWFVDLTTPLSVSVLVGMAGGPTTDLLVYMGSDTSNITANAQVGSSLTLDLPGAVGALAFVEGVPQTGRYVVLVAGPDGTSPFNISALEVYPKLANAAANKPLTLSDGRVLEGGTDGSLTTCITIQPSDSGTAWVTVDLGYVAAVTAVAAAVKNTASAAQATVFVTNATTGDFFSLPANQSCGNGGLPLDQGSYSALPCYIRGRYVSVAVPNQGALQLCELEVYLGADIEWPVPTPDAGGSLNLAAIIAPTVVGGLVLALVLTWCAAVWRGTRRRRRASAAARRAGAGAEAAAKPGSASPSTSPGAGGLSADPESGSEDNGFLVSLAASIGLRSLGAGTGRRGSASSAVFRSALASAPSLVSRPTASLRLAGSLGNGVSPFASAAAAAAGAGAARDAAPGAGAAPRALGPGSTHGSTDLTRLPPVLNSVNMAEVELVRLIGEGSFGQVWLAKYCETTVALKMLTNKMPSLSASLQQTFMLDQLQKEASIMARLRHPNCCQYLGLCLDPPSLLMEYCSQRSVDTILSAGRTDSKVAKSLSWPRLLSMAFDAAKGMLYLHTRQPAIIHRDLKSANLLVDSQWHVKIADFNLSRAMESEVMMSTICITNPRWLSPEILKGGQATLQSDVWAFGTVMWELMTWQLPFESMNPYQIINLVQSSGASLPVPEPSAMPAGSFRGYEPFVALMTRCWEIEPAARPEMAEVAARLRDILRAELLAARSRRLRSGQLPGGGVPEPQQRYARVRSAAPSPFSQGPSSAEGSLVSEGGLPPGIGFASATASGTPPGTASTTLSGSLEVGRGPAGAPPAGAPAAVGDAELAERLGSDEPALL